MSEPLRTHLVVKTIPHNLVLERWNDLLENTPFATYYVTPGFLEDPFVGEGERFAVLAFDGDRIDAALTGLKHGRKVAAGLAVRPQTIFRPGTDRASAAESLFRGLAELGGSDTDLITIYSRDKVDGMKELGFEAEECGGSDKVVMLDLTLGSDVLFKAFSDRRRTDLRKALKRGAVQVKMLETEIELTELYEVHREWSQGKGIEPDPFDSFRKLLSSKNWAVFIALTDGKIIGGTYVRFYVGGVAEYAANNSLSEYQSLRPNELLGWRAIEWACESGLTMFSLGASHPFLTRYGGDLVGAYRYQLDRTFLKTHTRREHFSRMAAKTYRSLPLSLRKQIKSVAAKL